MNTTVSSALFLLNVIHTHHLLLRLIYINYCTLRSQINQLMKQVQLLALSFGLLISSSLRGQDIRPFAFIHKTLIENEQLNGMKQFVQEGEDAAVVLVATAKIDREAREISIKYEGANENEVRSSLYTYNEEGKPISYQSYTVAGKQKDMSRYSYQSDGRVIHRSVLQDTNEDTPDEERWTLLKITSNYDENDNVTDFSNEGNARGETISTAGQYTYIYDEEGRMTQKIRTYRKSGSDEFLPLFQDNWQYSSSKIKHTSTSLVTGTKRVTTSWLEEDLIVKIKHRSDDKNTTTILTYENGLLSTKHTTGTNKSGDVNKKWIYEYE